ncbi:putative cysteine-rich receptor-like protein kinase 31 isoform X3 [Miscanthus floridulus]|uniref:putative cysteine-rich receptor-like protein kinase 31 isoform X3 n=1 Tax=Miscanthus floridulus TaxID=154761 RepID=UPI0034591596
MATQVDTYRTLEYMLCDKIGEPLSLKQHFLETITNNFSKDNLIGCGGYGEVYKGVLEDGLVAVKKLYSAHAIEDEPFHREVDCLMNIRHHNIVLFVGYCAETQEVVVHQEGKNIFAEKQERLLCFEYLRNGSLHKHLTDFGLSRLLGDEKSRTITQLRRGTWGYMAPEYLDNGVITIKSDIYSLGVIIRHMVKGRNSADTTNQDVLESWMIRLEKDSSQMRQQTQLLEIGYKEQIKACFEILQRCTRPAPKDRPTTEDILLTLEETEARVKLVAGPTPNACQLELAKFGPWGGDGGKPRDIKMLPYLLDNITISSGTIIDSIGFSYTDHYGQHHTIGPWGGKEGKNKIQLGPSEFLTGVSRTIGPFKSLINVITSLTFVTNTRSYGPFGKGRGTQFHIQMQNNGRVIGFFGRSNQYLNAIGVYTNQDARVARIGPLGGDGGVLHDIIDHNGQQHSAGSSGECGGSDHKPDVYAKFGPWGGDGGKPHDIKILPYRLDRVKISSGVIIDSIEFSYTDHDGQYHTTGPWGGHGGDNNSFQLGPLEFLIGVSGSIGTFNSQLNIITAMAALLVSLGVLDDISMQSVSTQILS